MAELKTKPTKASVTDFINKVPDNQKREDSFKLVELYKSITGEKPQMWGPSIIGFGKFHYKSERSRQEGDWPLGGFSPRKQSLTIYLMMGMVQKDLFKKLGKHKTSVGCLYINKLSDVDLTVLKQLIKSNYLAVKKKYSQ